MVESNCNGSCKLVYFTLPTELEDDPIPSHVLSMNMFIWTMNMDNFLF